MAKIVGKWDCSGELFGNDQLQKKDISKMFGYKRLIAFE